MLVETSQQLATGETLVFDLPESGSTTARVAWSNGRFLGCQFEHPLSAAALSAALLRSEPLERPPSASRKQELEQLYARLAEIATDEGPVSDDRYSLRTRGLVLLGLIVLSWAALAGLLTLI